MDPSAPAVLAAPQDSNGRLWGFEAGCSCKYLGYCSDKASNVQPDTSGRSGLCDACMLRVHDTHMLHMLHGMQRWLHSGLSS